MTRKYNTKILLLIIISILLILIKSIITLNAKQIIPRSWMVVKTLHFDIYYPDEISDLAVYTARIAEESYVYLADYLQHELTKVIPVVIHNKRNNNYLNNFNRVDISYTGSYISYHKTFTRKLSYVFQHEILFNKEPGWEIPAFSRLVDNTDFLMDTMAYYLAGGFNENTDVVIKDIIVNGKEDKLLNIKSLKKIRTNISREIGRSFFFFLEKEYGSGIIADLLLTIRDYDSIYKAIEIIAGGSIDKVNNKWIDFYRQRYANADTKASGINETLLLSEVGSSFIPIGTRQNSLLYYLTINPDRCEISKYDISVNKTDNLSFISGCDITSVCANNIFQLSNIPSFSQDGKIAFVREKRQAGKTSIVLNDLSSGKRIKEIVLPFNNILNANISKDGKFIVFIGLSYSSADVYIYNIYERYISRVTDDFFTKRFPEISGDNNFIVFSSNENKENNFESENFKLIKIDLKSKKKSILIDNNSKIIHPNISQDSNKILYISNTLGPYNVYNFDINSGKSTQITDVQYGAFFPCWLDDNRKITYSVYQDYKYNVIVKDITIHETFKDKKNMADYKYVNYPISYFDLDDLALSDYSEERNIKFYTHGSGLVWNDGFAGNIRIEAADILNEHRIELNSGFLRYDKYNKDKDFNFKLDYEFKKYRPGMGTGAYYRANPLKSGFFDNYKNDLNFYPDNINAVNYGMYAHINYPFDLLSNNGISFKIKASTTAYKDLNLFYDNMYLKEFSFSFNYDSIAYDKVWPVNGTRCDLEYSYDFTTGKRNISFNTAELNFLRLFSYNKLFVISLKGSAGKIFGKDDEYFKYYLGGFNSVRGHELFAYKGQNIFLFNLETRLIMIDKIIISWPAQIIFNDISLGFFADCGSAWNNDYRFKNPDTGEFDDFKTAFGIGLRFLLQNHLVFKIDTAWPYYYTSWGKRDIIFGFELCY